MANRHAIIVGGGVTGLSTAYHLKRLGYGDVTIFEKDTIGAGSSSRAAGISTGLLWSKTGILARKTALRRFREMSRELDGYVFHNEQGCLGLFSPELWPGREALLPLYDEYDVPYQVLSAAEIRRRWPMLNPLDDHLGVLDPLGGYSEPPEYLAALTAKLKQLEVRIVTGATVDGIETKNGRAIGVRTEGRVVQGDAVVVANYAWVLPLLKTVDISIPAKTFLHRRYVSAPMLAPFVAPPVNADPYFGYVRPADGNRILVGAETPDLDDIKLTDFRARYDQLEDDPKLRDEVVGRFIDFVPAMRGLDWETRKVGLLSFSMDGEPILGPFGGMEGLFVGVCFHSGGFSYNPASGYYLAEFVARGETSIDLTAFSPDRFAADETAAYVASTVPQRNAARRRH
ncbi:MAG: FAD-binding oxidoreductase [Hyphomicrobiales bacterium]|nr:MAG: FAD-binding oxidoreductase [Hyphomicrobiales bacterium]